MIGNQVQIVAIQSQIQILQYGFVREGNVIEIIQ